MTAVEAGEILRHFDLQRWIERHTLHIGNVRTPQQCMRQQKVRGLGAFVQCEHGDDRPARTARLQCFDENLLLALAHGRIDLGRRQRHVCSAARQCQRYNNGAAARVRATVRPYPASLSRTWVDDVS